MTASKVYYYERASVFDRGLILMLAVACIFLANSKSSCDRAIVQQDNLRQSFSVVEQRKTGGSYDQSFGGPAGKSLKMKPPLSSSLHSTDIKSLDINEKKLPKNGGETSNKAGVEGKSWQEGWKEKKKEIKLKEESTSVSPSLLTEKKSSGGSKKSSESGVDGKNWQEGWKEKNKAAIKERKKKKTGTLPGGIPADTLWKNKHDVVHIMTTRYMQLQPNLIHLGKARNDLFRTFTLPSVVAQSTQEFIWIIMTDPDLNEELLNEIIDMIKPYKNILLIGMNNGLGNFREYGWMNNIAKVFSGNLQMLKDYRVASKARVLLETRIDADDSIFVEMMDSVQLQAAETMGKRAKAHNYDVEKITKEYRIFCTEHHLEWGYFNPWEKSSDKGHIFGVTHEEFCVSAGLTYGYQIGSGKDELPTTSHHKMAQAIPTCMKTSNNRNCLERINAGNYKYIMLRSRTPTSAGMFGVIPTKEVIESDTWKNQQDWAWANLIEKNFAVKPQTIWELREKLKKNMVDILTDALAGQCTKAEFTCKDTTKRDLENLLQEVAKNS